MGGAVALKVHFKQPHTWDGAILVAPMCKQILICIAKILPREKLVPQKDLAEMSFKDIKKREQISLPLIILHGEADIVTDPSVSKALYEKTSSLDKKLCLYKDAYHSILEGESDEMIFKVLDDIISWLEEHCCRRAN
ncbi:hypothetical protein BHE74_00057770 [Ensete ventricosum]|nr:hypothetical protein GW17_00029340 [Ensete ventricosum]RWW37155.1 hypothetical protein BHE74_00057770 [Ensete ventricosum]RZS27750.1 hypothetical protein BHM03_00061272 [Ensete ventricosum]